MEGKSTVVITGIDERLRQLQLLDTKNPQMEQRIREVIRLVLRDVRTRLSAEVSSGLGMKSDPRKAYKAVRYSVYRRIFGGHVNILQKRRAGRQGNFRPDRSARTGLRGGNRWGRSSRTADVDGYVGADRGFILRFMNSGTDERSIHSYTSRDGNRYDIRGGGRRGSIAARNWFGGASHRELESAAGRLDDLINEIVTTVMY